MSTDGSIEAATSKAKTAFLWFASSTALWQFISWVFTIVIARILDPSDYGVFTYINTIIPYAVILATLRLETWIIQEDKFDREMQETILTFLLVLSLTVSFLMYAGAPYIAEFYKEPDLVLVCRIIAITFVFKAVRTLPDSLLRRDLKFKEVAFVNLGVGVFRNLLQLALALSGYGFWTLVYGFVFAEVASCLLLWLITKPSFGFRWNLEIIKRAVRFGFYVSGGTILWILGSTADDIAVGKFLGKEMLGFYSMAFLLSEMPLSKIHGLLSPVLLAYFSRIKHRPEEHYQIFLKVVRGLAAVLSPILIGLAIVAYELFLLLLGEKWLPAVPIFQLFCVVWLLKAYIGNISPLFNSIGKPERAFQFNLVRCLLLVPSFFLLTPWLGIKGVYLSWIFVYPISVMYLLVLLRRTTGITFGKYFSNLTPVIISTLGMSAATLVVKYLLAPYCGPLILLLAEIAAGVISYTAILWFGFRKQSMEMYSALFVRR